MISRLIVFVLFVCFIAGAIMAAPSKGQKRKPLPKEAPVSCQTGVALPACLFPRR